jgi:hypothetical protein
MVQVRWPPGSTAQPLPELAATTNSTAKAVKVKTMDERNMFAAEIWVGKDQGCRVLVNPRHTRTVYLLEISEGRYILSPKASSKTFRGYRVALH